MKRDISLMVSVNDLCVVSEGCSLVCVKNLSVLATWPRNNTVGPWSERVTVLYYRASNSHFCVILSA